MNFLIEYGLYIGILAMLFGVTVMMFPLWSSEEKRWVRIAVSGGGAVVVLLGFFLALGSYSAGELHTAAQTQEQELTGQPAPDIDFELLGEHSGDRSLSSYQGQVVLINFWATWCPPCIHEMPDLSRLQESYEDELAVLCISDETPGEVNEFLDDFEPLSQPVGILKNAESLPEAYSLLEQFRPVSFVIDRDGTIREVIRGARNYRQFEAEILPYL